jgi:hypothetical protein
LMVPGFELRPLCLLGRLALPHPFCFSYLWGKELCLCPGQPGAQSSYLHFPIVGMTGMCLCAQLLDEVREEGGGGGSH